MTLRARARAVGSLARIVRCCASDWRFWRQQGDGEFAERGYEVLSGFLEPVECKRLVALAEAHVGSRSRLLAGEAYFVRRAEKAKGGGTDSQVMQLFNVQCLDEHLATLADRRVFERLFEDRLGVPMRLETLSIQIDDPDTETKRSFHVDRLAPASFKAFVYLTAVESTRHGPYTVVAGSHRRPVRRLCAAAWAVTTRLRKTDHPLFYDLEDGTPILGSAGTLILSCQQLAHRGHPSHSERRRYMLVAYMVPERHAAKAPFDLGRKLAEAT